MYVIGKVNVHGDKKQDVRLHLLKKAALVPAFETKNYFLILTIGYCKVN